MDQKQYIKVTEAIRRHKKLEKVVIYANEILTRIVYMAYCVLLFCLAVNKDVYIVRVVLVTGVSFVLVSAFRKIVDSKRPYTLYSFKPIIEKDKKGQSMPSRHVFSAFIIGIAFLPVNIWIAIIIFVDGFLMCIGRVVAGVHFPKDVLSGAALGVALGYIGFFVV